MSKNKVTELKKINCFDATKYLDNGVVTYELSYNDCIIASFDNYNDMIEFAKNFDYSLFYEDDWIENMESDIFDFSKTA